ncbi:MAG TPA: hypothetical protein DCE18_05545, partial [Syntrophobacteraceae bacterium]|nr:hypothetical protein [Syntrophobacteraceae bacterium]
MKTSSRLLAALGFLLVAVSFFPACTLLRLKSETEFLNHVSEIAGAVEAPAFSGKPIVVVLLSINPAKPDQGQAVAGRVVLQRPGAFRFFAEPGSYHIGAFEDLNENVSFQSDEPVGWHGDPDVITVAGGRNITGIRAVLRPPEQARREFPRLYEPVTADVTDLTKRFRLGEVTGLDNNPLFAADNRSMGLWEPLRFLNSQYSGLYFLEPYVPEKIPVLFIHGAGGNPTGWSDIIQSLDRRYFQPWVLFYPSGLRLEIIRQAVSNALTTLQVRYKFDRLYLVAHSMGGLVAGGVINGQTETGNSDYLRLLITLSTPWGGAEMAAKGVSQSPVVIPCWYDMVPGSPYQEAIFSRPFPPALEYHLLFSYRGGFNVMLGGNTDGTVSLRRQLLIPHD